MKNVIKKVTAYVDTDGIWWPTLEEAIEGQGEIVKKVLETCLERKLRLFLRHRYSEVELDEECRRLLAQMLIEHWEEIKDLVDQHLETRFEIEKASDDGLEGPPK